LAVVIFDVVCLPRRRTKGLLPLSYFVIPHSLAERSLPWRVQKQE